MELTRRSFVTALLWACPAYACAAWPKSEHRDLLQKPVVVPTGNRNPGCTISAGSTDDVLARRIELDKVPDVHTTGRKVLDLEGPALAVILGVSAPIGFYEDDSPNAVALRPTPSSTTGMILIGVNLIRRVQDIFEDSALIGIIAHEAAHLMQYQKTPKWQGGMRPELHADFMAGWYLAEKIYRGGLKTINEEAFARTLEALGDCDFNDLMHHGTAEQRRVAMEAGSKSASRRRTRTPSEAYAAGMAHVGGA